MNKSVTLGVSLKTVELKAVAEAEAGADSEDLDKVEGEEEELLEWWEMEVEGRHLEAL